MRNQPGEPYEEHARHREANSATATGDCTAQGHERDRRLASAPGDEGIGNTSTRQGLTGAA